MSGLTQQAMVHELIGIQDNKVDLKNAGKVSKDQQVSLLYSLSYGSFWYFLSLWNQYW